MSVYVNNTKGTYKYLKYCRDGSTKEVTAVIRSRTAKRQQRAAAKREEARRQDQ